MATVKPIKPKRPYDHVAYELVMLALSEARAARFLLDVVTSEESRFECLDAREERYVEDHLSWIRSRAMDWLRDCHDKIELEYRKLGTNLLQKEAAATPKPKDGA